MKTCSALTLLALLLSALAGHAADKVAGPKGGRLLEKSQPRAEFHVEKDRTVSITFYDAQLKATPAGRQIVTVIADAKGSKTRLELEKQGDILTSKGKLPEGDGYLVVVQIQSVPDAKPQNYRFQLDLHNCGGCQRAEYACTCNH